MHILNNMNPYRHCRFKGTNSNREIDSLFRELNNYSDYEKIYILETLRKQINRHNLTQENGQKFVKTVSNFLYSNSKDLKFAAINTLTDALKENYADSSNVVLDNYYLKSLLEPEFAQYHPAVLNFITNLQDKNFNVGANVYTKVKNVILERINTKNPDEILVFLKLFKTLVKIDFLNKTETEAFLKFVENHTKSNIPEIRLQVQVLKDIYNDKKQKSEIKVRVISPSELPDSRHCEGYQNIYSIFKSGMYSKKDIHAKVREIITRNNDPEMITEAIGLFADFQMLKTNELSHFAPFLHSKMNSANMFLRIAAVKAIGNYAKYKPLPVSLIDKNIKLLFKYSERNRASEGDISVAIAALSKYAHHNRLSFEEGKALEEKALKNLQRKSPVLVNTCLNALAELIDNNYTDIKNLNISEKFLENLFEAEFKEVHPGLNKLISVLSDKNYEFPGELIKKSKRNMINNLDSSDIPVLGAYLKILKKHAQKGNLSGKEVYATLNTIEKCLEANSERTSSKALSLLQTYLEIPLIELSQLSKYPLAMVEAIRPRGVLASKPD